MTTHYWHGGLAWQADGVEQQLTVGAEP